MAKIDQHKKSGMPHAATSSTLTPKKLANYTDSVKPGIKTSQKDGSKARTGGK